MDFVLTLHSHLPWVLHHGRWPHGSDWLCEAAVDTYLPLLATLEALERQATPAPITLGITPVLANQLAHPSFRRELDAFLTQRESACLEAAATLGHAGEGHLVPLTQFWRARFQRLRRLFERHDGDLLRAFGHQAAAGRLELTSSAATHGFLPLLARDESIRLQLLLGQSEHHRLFGIPAPGCWVPECAYRPAGPWQPDPSAPQMAWRDGIEHHLAEAGFRYFFTDSHQAAAGRTLGLYGEADMVDGLREPAEDSAAEATTHSPYRAYRVGDTGAQAVQVLVRDPVSSLRVWSRHQGFPGDEAYLEFHKIRWPGGLKLWRVTGTDVDLGGKLAYDQNVGRARAHRDAATYVRLATQVARHAAPTDTVLAVPFDTELFGHWWFEGVDFLGDTYRALAGQDALRPVTAGQHLATSGAAPAIPLAQGSWGANGDFSKWLNPGTLWTWQRLWGLEERFWTLARTRLDLVDPVHRAAWAQATRELLLAQSSDWQFIISTGAAADYAERRFREHCDGLEALLDGLARPGTMDRAGLGARTEALARVDDLFPDPLPILEQVVRR